MNNNEREFLRYLRIKEIQEGRLIIQAGGVIERVRIGDHNIEYDINSYNNKSIDLIAQATKKANDKKPCFIMNIIPGGASSLISISRGIGCFEDNHDNTSDIVLAAIKIAKLKGAKTFDFTDKSTKTVNKNKINLADLSFLTTGKTWYERILPIKPSKRENLEEIEFNRKKVISNTWKEVFENLLKLGVEANLDTESINVDEKGSAMKVLERAKKTKKYYAFFNECMYKLLTASSIQSMQNKEWIMTI